MRTILRSFCLKLLIIALLLSLQSKTHTKTVTFCNDSDHIMRFTARMIVPQWVRWVNDGTPVARPAADGGYVPISGEETSNGFLIADVYELILQPRQQQTVIFDMADQNSKRDALAQQCGVSVEEVTGLERAYSLDIREVLLPNANLTFNLGTKRHASITMSGEVRLSVQEPALGLQSAITEASQKLHRDVALIAAKYLMPNKILVINNQAYRSTDALVLGHGDECKSASQL